MLTSLATASLIFLIFLPLQGVVLRFWQVRHKVRAMALVLIVCLLASHPIYDGVRRLDLDHLLPGKWQAALVATLVFTFLWICFVEIYLILDTSVSLRMLIHFLETPTHRLTFRELAVLYPFQDVLRRRLDRAVSAGLILRQSLAHGPEQQGDDHGDCYLLSPTGRSVGRWFSWLKRGLRLGEGG